MIPFNVLIGADGKFVTTAQAAAFEHGTPIGRGHALAKTMHPQPAADLGLIRSFWHDIRSSLTYR